MQKRFAIEIDAAGADGFLRLVGIHEVIGLMQENAEQAEARLPLVKLVQAAALEKASVQRRLFQRERGPRFHLLPRDIDLTHGAAAEGFVNHGERLGAHDGMPVTEASAPVPAPQIEYYEVRRPGQYNLVGFLAGRRRGSPILLKRQRDASRVKGVAAPMGDYNRQWRGYRAARQLPDPIAASAQPFEPAGDPRAAGEIPFDEWPQSTHT